MLARRLHSFDVQCWKDGKFLTVLDQTTAAAQARFAKKNAGTHGWQTYSFDQGSSCSSRMWRLTNMNGGPKDSELRPAGIFVYEVVFGDRQLPTPTPGAPLMMSGYMLMCSSG